MGTHTLIYNFKVSVCGDKLTHLGVIVCTLEYMQELQAINPMLTYVSWEENG